MILCALLIALSCTYSGALAGLTAGDDGDCALYLSGPGRTSAYDYTINLLKGNFGYEGQNTCITYEAVNQAYLEARNRILVSQPKGDWKPEDFASVGELVLDISINLARRYGLTYEEVEKGLPLIDTSRTLIREVCPPVFSHVECRAGKYRRLDGLCNNLQHPTWGSTNSPFQRLISPLFADGINSPRISHSGRDLPLSRVVSRTMHPDDGFHDHAGTVMVIAWGQFMDHDYTLTGTPLDPINRNDPEECCKRPSHLKHPYCNEIRIPDDDYFYRLFGVKCIDFVRAFPSPRPGCRLGSRIPFNTLTGAIDGNTVYGVTEKFARKLRTGFGGLLRMNPVFKEYGLKDLLPLKLDIPDEGCTRPNKNMYCFEAGEIRVNEQLILTVMHTLMAREHNRVANALAEVNPHWDDETLYQEARRINIAEIQHITYNEFLPILLGKDVMEKFGLVLEKEGFWEGYDPEVNPDVLAAFAAAAYRFGHSLLPTAVERWSKAHKFIASKRLSDLIRRPYDLYRAGVLDEYVMGLMNQVAQAMDDSITQEVTNHLFKKVGARFGMDLVSFNMQRGREFGLPGYMEFRKFCGLPGAETFQDLFGTMTNHTVRKYETIFEHPIDVDLWSGGVSERPLPGSMLGPTFACIIATQFSYSRRGDRFWFELQNQPSSFTPEQLAEIRKSRLARIICDNTDIIDTVQLYPMVLPDHELNPRVPCRSGIIPMMDFSKWAEPAPFHRPAKQYVTSANITNYNGTISETPLDTESFSYNDSKENDDIIKNINILILSHLNDTEEEAFTSDKVNAELNLTVILQNPENATTEIVDSKVLEPNANSSNTEQTSQRINTTQLNEIPENNLVLKYVYKKDDKANETLKPEEGHDKITLSRRKRSHSKSQEIPDDTQNASEIVNYETLHGRITGDPSPLPSANIIRNSDLAEFSIQTLHQPTRITNPTQGTHPVKYSDKPHTKTDERYATSDSLESKKPYTDTESSEKYNNDNSREDRKRYRDDGSNERYDDIYSKEDKKRYRDNDSIEKYDNTNSREDSRPLRNNDSSEKYDNNPRDEKKQYRDSNSRENYDNRSKEDKQTYRDRETDNRYKNNDSSEDKKHYREKLPNNRYENNDSVEDIKPHRKEKYNDKYDNNDSNSEKSYVDSAESSESQEFGRNRPNSSNGIRGNSRYIQKGDAKPYDDSKESRESTEQESLNYPSRPSTKESEESNGRTYDGSSKSTNINKSNNNVESTNAPYYKNKDSSNESKNSEESKSGLIYSEPRKTIYSSNENSNESSEEVLRPKNYHQAEYKNGRINNSLPKIQDVDLNDFSYERIQINNKGEVEPSKEVHDSSENKFSSEILNATTPKSEIKSQNYNELHSLSSKETTNLPSNLEAINNSAELININDGEVKPVVELNLDTDSIELTEEKPNLAFKVKEQDQSLESLLGVKESESIELNDKIQEQKTAPPNDGDVKQQFERIPLNYKHSGNAEKPKSIDIKSTGTENDAPKIKTLADKVPETQNEGTLDTFAPPERFDENLNIKFDDLVINLPEIKLPDDILEYSRDDSPYIYGKRNDDNAKHDYYNYRDEQSEEQKGENKNVKTKENLKRDEDDRGYYGYYDDYQDKKKQKYQKKQDNDDEEEEQENEEEDEVGEDLYEKFVRERFGKQGSFEKRSENLQDTRDVPQNKELYKTVQNILKKTEDVQKQAVASGDPKAGYMWTLEYGENAK